MDVYDRVDASQANSDPSFDGLTTVELRKRARSAGVTDDELDDVAAHVTVELQRNELMQLITHHEHPATAVLKTAPKAEVDYMTEVIEHKFGVSWGRQRIRVTSHGIEIQRTTTPCKISFCTQRTNVAVPWKNVGRFRTTASSASIIRPVRFLLEGAFLSLLFNLYMSGGLSEVTPAPPLLASPNLVAGCLSSSTHGSAACTRSRASTLSAAMASSRS